MKRQFFVFIFRWLLNSFGLWIAVRLLGTGYNHAEVGSLHVFLFAGFIFSIVNAVLKPIITILSLPAILLTLGLFTIVVNGLMVYIAVGLSPGIAMTFEHSILTGLVLSLVNYIVSNVLELSYASTANPKERL